MNERVQRLLYFFPSTQYVHVCVCAKLCICERASARAQASGVNISVYSLVGNQTKRRKYE